MPADRRPQPGRGPTPPDPAGPGSGPGTSGPGSSGSGSSGPGTSGPGTSGSGTAGDGGAEDGTAGPALTGPDLARAALAAAKARAKERGLAPRAARRAAPPRRRGDDDRDPVLFGAAIARLVGERGWQATTSAARVVGEWDALVGAEIADHCRPASLLDGELVLVAESSAWATQLRLLAPALHRRLAEAVGPGIVRTVVVRGPSQPDWRRGPRRVQGRGPRDTYG